MNTTYIRSMKVVVYVLTSAAVFSIISLASAQAETTSATTTPVATTSATIEGLMAQLAKLTELFNQLKAQMTGMKFEMSILREGIKEGSNGDDVREIQRILASDSLIYPAGLTTGYFGPLTTSAIKKFQEKNSLEVTGVINVETKAALDIIIEQRNLEGKIPFGLLIAPGQRIKFEGRLKMHCVQMTASSTDSSTCEKVKEKYKFEVDEKGRIKMESEIKVKDEDLEDSGDEDSEDEDNEDDNN